MAIIYKKHPSPGIIWPSLSPKTIFIRPRMVAVSDLRSAWPSLNKMMLKTERLAEVWPGRCEGILRLHAPRLKIFTSPCLSLEFSCPLGYVDKKRTNSYLCVYIVCKVRAIEFIKVEIY